MPVSVRCTRCRGSRSFHALQVTPVFGILNDLQQRRAGSDGNGGPGGMVPQKVVLVYVASMKRTSWRSCSGLSLLMPCRVALNIRHILQ